MSTNVISYHVCRCDGCSTPFSAPDPADETEYQAERRAVRAGWKKCGADVVCQTCAALHSWERPNGQRMQRGCKVGTGA